MCLTLPHHLGGTGPFSIRTVATAAGNFSSCERLYGFLFGVAIGLSERVLENVSFPFFGGCSSHKNMQPLCRLLGRDCAGRQSTSCYWRETGTKWGCPVQNNYRCCQDQSFRQQVACCVGFWEGILRSLVVERLCVYLIEACTKLLAILHRTIMSTNSSHHNCA